MNNNNKAGANGDMDASVSYSLIRISFRCRCDLLNYATSFVGRALVENLLHSCPVLGTIYLLTHPKRRLDVQTRHNKLFKDPVSTTHFSHYFSTVRCKTDTKPPNISLIPHFYKFYHGPYLPYT
jgi:hypothetical protein